MAEIATWDSFIGIMASLVRVQFVVMTLSANGRHCA